METLCGNRRYQRTTLYIISIYSYYRYNSCGPPSFLTYCFYIGASTLWIKLDWIEWKGLSVLTSQLHHATQQVAGAFSWHLSLLTPINGCIVLIISVLCLRERESEEEGLGPTTRQSLGLLTNHSLTFHLPSVRERERERERERGSPNLEVRSGVIFCFHFSSRLLFDCQEFVSLRVIGHMGSGPQWVVISFCGRPPAGRVSLAGKYLNTL